MSLRLIFGEEPQRRPKRKAPGLDGWSILELSKLPVAAWGALLRVLVNGGDSPYMSLLSAFRRLPLDKGKPGIPDPKGFRPVDIFSAVLRTLSSTQVGKIMGWLRETLDECQFAMKGGTIQVAVRAAIIVERVVSLKRPTFGVSIDFSCLFNTLCPVLAGRVAARQGLPQEDVDALIRPIVMSRGFGAFRDRSGHPSA